MPQVELGRYVFAEALAIYDDAGFDWREAIMRRDFFDVATSVSAAEYELMTRLRGTPLPSRFVVRGKPELLRNLNRLLICVRLELEDSPIWYEIFVSAPENDEVSE
jgi:hypothetical protein